MKSDKTNITRLLQNARDGNKQAFDILYPQVYDRLRDIAQRQLAHEQRDHTLQKTSLVHELYLKLIDQSEVEWEDRAHFFAIASRCMRQILVDYARKKSAERRGGKGSGITLDEDRLNVNQHAEELIEMNDLLDKLSQYNERRSRVVEMRFFGGMTIPEISEVLNVNSRTVDRDWAKAKTWLYSELRAS